jgi:glycosyltransferase involved in cell wall biosynthesis
MHILFVHQNYPAQFGHIADCLVKHGGFECTFVSERPPSDEGGVRRIQYKKRGGARKENHFCSRTFENCVWHCDGVYRAMQAHPEVRPDLVVGHSGFGSTLFLRDLYDCPIINYFEFYYHVRDSDLDFRPDFPVSPITIRRARTRNAMLLLDLQECSAGYCPTRWQLSRLPDEYQYKLRALFDGIDTNVWKPIAEDRRRPLVINGRQIPSGMKIVTYASRGFESMRGFDIFMKVVKRLCDERDDVFFICVGSDRVCYGGDLDHIKEKSFQEHVLAGDDYDMERIVMPGMVSPEGLATIFDASHLHIYLTAPFVLSWSMMNAMACGCTILASDTGPVQEMIQHGENGLLADFFDVDRFVELANEALDDRQRSERLGAAALATIREHYSLDVVFPKFVQFYEEVGGK